MRWTATHISAIITICGVTTTLGLGVGAQLMRVVSAHQTHSPRSDARLHALCALCALCALALCFLARPFTSHLDLISSHLISSRFAAVSSRHLATRRLRTVTKGSAGLPRADHRCERLAVHRPVTRDRHPHGWHAKLAAIPRSGRAASGSWPRLPRHTAADATWLHRRAATQRQHRRTRRLAASPLARRIELYVT